MVDENCTLIAETNNLRKNLRGEIRRNKKMESLLGLTNKYMLARQAQKRLNDAVATTEEIHEEYKQKIKVMLQKIIRNLKIFNSLQI